MTVRLLDSGVWLAARDVDDRFHEPSLELVRTAAADEAIGALDLGLYEVATVATVRWHSREEAIRLIELVLTAAGERLIRVDGSLGATAVAIAADHGITVYDAAYVACARERGWRLVSTDLRHLVEPGLAETPEAALA